MPLRRRAALRPATVDCRGVLVVAKQRIHVGIVHAGRTLTVEAADSTWRVYDEQDGLVAEVARATTKPIARFKVHKPEPPRSRPPRVDVVVAHRSTQPVVRSPVTGEFAAAPGDAGHADAELGGDEDEFLLAAGVGYPVARVAREQQV